MRAFALTCEAIAHLDGIEAKVQCAAGHLISRSPEERPIAARFLAGTPLPPGALPPNVGGASIATVVAERCGIPSQVLRRRAVSSGDLGTAVCAALESAAAGGFAGKPGLTLVEAARAIAELGAHTGEARLARLRRLFEPLDPLEAKYLTKLLVGSMRIGMQAGRVEEAIALAFDVSPDTVRRSHMLLGDIGLVAERAGAADLDRVRLRSFRPVRCMLAHPADDAAGVLAHLQPPLIVEPKLDGVRAQLHVRAGRHRVYSRSLEDITHLFPEIGDDAAGLDDEWILDGEVVAWKDAPLPFELLQQRLGRRQVPLTMLLDVPVVYQVFDVLRASGRDLIDEPLARRKEILDDFSTDGSVRRLPHERVDDPAVLDQLFERAVADGHEGLVVKDPTSAYHPGSRGREWLKLKRPLGTLDVVVTAAQYGGGKRAGWLSDLTFAVRGEDGELLEVGKAYSGLTDEQIRHLTEHFKSTTVERSADMHRVEPTVVLEVTFSGIQRSSRHPSGFALRFPRIVRLREDLDLDGLDDLDRLEELYAEQRARAAGDGVR